MELVTRVLNLQDREQIVALSRESDLLFGVAKPADYQERFERHLDKYLDPQPGNKRAMTGSFYDGRLMATFGMIFWSDAPYWTACNMKVGVDAQKLGARHNGLAASYALAVELAEADGFFTHYCLGPLRGYTSRPGENVLQRLVPALRRYDFVTESFIPAGTQPTFSKHWSLMGQSTHSADLVVQVATLRQEFRPEPLCRRANRRQADMDGAK